MTEKYESREKALAAARELVEILDFDCITEDFKNCINVHTNNGCDECDDYLLKRFPYAKAAELKSGDLCDFSEHKDFRTFVTGRFYDCDTGSYSMQYDDECFMEFKYCRPHTSPAPEEDLLDEANSIFNAMIDKFGNTANRAVWSETRDILNQCRQWLAKRGGQDDS